MAETKSKQSQSSAVESAVKPKPTRSIRIKWLVAVALIYSLWMIWLLYVGIVNLRAGNQ